jgi:DNA-binding MarR family transcriptional regulator
LIPKERFWIGAKGGLLDRKHLDAMGEAIWLFLYFLMRQTEVNNAGEGVVLYGKPLSRRDLAEDTGWPESRIKVWTARLRKHGYIRTVPSGNDGQIVFIRKAKNKAKNRKPSTHYFPIQSKPDRVTADVTQMQIGSEPHRPQRQVGRDSYQGWHESAPTYATNSHASQSDACLPTTLTPKSLSNYNNTAAAKAAAVSLSCLAKDKSIPRAKTQRELDERRRFLLRQGEEIKAKHAQAH